VQELTPWWVATGAGLVTALAGVIGKLWSDHMASVRALREDLASARSQLAEANARNAELQKSEHEEHVRDLRRIAGLAASWPPQIIRKR
jgi:hypothetical protein